MNDAVLESVAVFDGIRSLTGGRAFGRRSADPGGVLSGVRVGVGVVRWLVEVVGLDVRALTVPRVEVAT